MKSRPVWFPSALLLIFIFIFFSFSDFYLFYNFCNKASSDFRSTSEFFKNSKRSI
jgi:hypothetical protein